MEGTHDFERQVTTVARYYVLKPDRTGRVKSFYGRAHVLEDDEGNAVLVSYATPVCWTDRFGGFHRTWDGWSATTARHVDEFRAQRGLGRIGKAEWDALEVEAAPPGSGVAP